MSTTDKFETGKQHKDTGDQAFKAGDYKKALGSYYSALMYLQGLDKNAMGSMGMSAPRPAETEADKELAEVDDVISKTYSNMSACHMSLRNWQRAIETADKALKKNDKNYRALFRKGKAFGEQGFFEKAVKILEECKTKNPEDAAKVDAEIVRLRVIDDKKEKANSKRLKGFLNKTSASLDVTTENPSEEKSSDPEIEEIHTPGVAGTKS